MKNKIIQKISIVCLTFVFVFAGFSMIANAKPFVWVDKPKDYGNNSKEYSIMGDAIATKEQCLKYLLKSNPRPSLTVSPKQLVDYYYEEGNREGIETGHCFCTSIARNWLFPLWWISSGRSK